MKYASYWRLAEQLSVIQATLLIVGLDPSEIQYEVGSWDVKDRPLGYEAVISSLQHAVRCETIPATVRHDARTFNTFDEYEVKLNHLTAEAKKESIRDLNHITAVAFKTEPNWHLTVIRVDDLRQWLSTRGMKTGFFFPANESEGFLDASNPYYSHKLAAAHFVWTTVTSNPGLLNGKTPSQAMEKCLLDHLDRFKLTLKDQKPNMSGIKDVCRVANWKPEGGAAPTPTRVKSNPTPVKKSAKPSLKSGKKLK